MNESELKSLVAEVLVLRNTTASREQENELVRSGAVLNSQIGGADLQKRCAERRPRLPGRLHVSLHVRGDVDVPA